MKHSSRKLSKKGIVGLKRVTNKDGKRVWNYQGVEFNTLREVIFQADRLKNKP